MIVFKRAIHRRTFLRGIGTTLALPFFDAMSPVFGDTAAKPAMRMGIVYVPNGIIADKWTVPEDVRKRRRSRKLAGKAPQAAATGPDRRGDPPRPRSSRPRSQAVKTATARPPG